MKRKIMKTLPILTVIGILALVSFGQSNSKRVVFAKGKNSAVEKFTIPANDGISYLFTVAKDNLVKFTVTGTYSDGSDAEGLAIKLSKLGDDSTLAEASPGQEVEYQFIKGGGDHEVTVMNEGRKRANITLKITVNGESSESDVCEGCDNPNSTDGPERIKLAKGQSDVDVDIVLDGRETKQYVAYVTKGTMTCVLPATNLGSGVTIKVDGKVLNPNNGPCTDHALKSGDQIIEFTSNGNKEKHFSVSIGFHQHM